MHKNHSGAYLKWRILSAHPGIYLVGLECCLGTSLVNTRFLPKGGHRPDKPTQNGPSATLLGAMSGSVVVKGSQMPSAGRVGGWPGCGRCRH